MLCPNIEPERNSLSDQKYFISSHGLQLTKFQMRAAARPGILGNTCFEKSGNFAEDVDKLIITWYKYMVISN